MTSLPGMFIKYSNTLCDESKFRRFRYSNAYVENDILFNFALKKLSSGKYTLEFGMHPLCRNIQLVDQGSFELYMLDYDFEGTLEINELWQYVISEIIPLFCSCSDAKKALHSLIGLYNRIHLVRIDYCNKHNIIDNGWPIEKTIYFDDDVFYLAMKVQDYESMNKSLSYMIPISQTKTELFSKEFEKFTSRKDSVNAAVYEKKMEREKGRLLFLKTLQDHSLLQDYAFFAHLIEEREDASRNNLPHKLFS